VTLKIERYSDGRGTTIRLIGWIRGEHLEELEKQIGESGPNVALDLAEVNLVDLQVVRFLGGCEARGMSLLKASPYIYHWIAREGPREKHRP